MIAPTTKPDPQPLAVVTLDPGERMTARIFAALRTGINRSLGVLDRKKSPRSGLSVELDGIGGEIAFAKHRNVYLNLSVAPRSGGRDCLIHGLTVDVKTTPKEDGDLLVHAGKARNPCDVYVLMTGTFPTYTYRGFALKGGIFVDSNLNDLGHGPTYLVPQANLRK